MKTDEELNDLLNSYSVAPASAGLKQRILQTTSQLSPWTELLALIGGWRIAGPALAASVMCGVVTQLWWGQTVPDTVADDSVWTLAMLDTTQEWTHE